VIFPAICPVCHSDSGRLIIPASPEVDTYRCGACGHEWSQPASHREAIPVDELPRLDSWLRIFRRR
jgi:hypothetical protein